MRDQKDDKGKGLTYNEEKKMPRMAGVFKLGETGAGEMVSVP